MSEKQENFKIPNDPTQVEAATLAEAVKRPADAVQSDHVPFLEKVMVNGGLSDPYDARDITEVIFRVMRDLMTTEAADRIADELHTEVLETKDKRLQMEVTDLWKDTNPLVGFLSRIRPPLQGPSGITSERFLFRVANESGLGSTVNLEQVIKAVFAATKDELSQERIAEIATWLPDVVQDMWNQA